MANKLTPKQLRFIDEYLIDLNATQACIRAGYAPKRADQIGYENLGKPDIVAVIQERQLDLREKAQITQEDVIADIIRIRDRAIAEGLLNTALKALELLAKHLGMFEKDNRQKQAPPAVILNLAGPPKAQL